MEDPTVDARAVLREAYDQWAASPSWTLLLDTGAGERVAAAVRPGLEWIDLPHQHATVLVRDGVAHLKGLGAVLMTARPLADAVAEAVVEALADGWLTVPAADWSRRGAENTALGLAAGDLRSTVTGPEEELTVDDVTVQGDARLVRVATWSGRVVVRLEPERPAQVVSMDDVVDGESIFGMSSRLVLGEAPLTLPEPAPNRPLAEVLAEGGARSRRRRSRRVTGVTPTVEVLAPEEPDEQWSLHSDDLAEALGVEAGYEAEALALQLLAERAPHLVHLVEGDSYDTVFSAYVPDRETAEAVAAVLRTPNP